MSSTFETLYKYYSTSKIADKSLKREKKKHQTFKSHSPSSRCSVSRSSDFSRKHLHRSPFSESNFNKKIFVFDVRNLASIREDCPVDLLKEVKMAPMAYKYWNDVRDYKLYAVASQ